MTFYVFLSCLTFSRTLLLAYVGSIRVQNRQQPTNILTVFNHANTARCFYQMRYDAV